MAVRSHLMQRLRKAQGNPLQTRKTAHIDSRSFRQIVAIQIESQYTDNMDKTDP